MLADMRAMTPTCAVFSLLAAGCFGPPPEHPDPDSLPVAERWNEPPEGAQGERLEWILDLLNDRVEAPGLEHGPDIWHYSLLDRRSANELAASFETAARLAPYEVAGLVARVDETHWIVGLTRNGLPVLLSFRVDDTPSAHIEEARLRPWDLDNP